MKKLSKNEMKKVIGGLIDPPPTETCNCNSKDDCGTDKPCCVSCSGSKQYAGVCHTECI